MLRRVLRCFAPCPAGLTALEAALPAYCHGPPRWDFHDLSPSHPGADTRVLEVSRL